MRNPQHGRSLVVHNLYSRLRVTLLCFVRSIYSESDTGKTGGGCSSSPPDTHLLCSTVRAYLCGRPSSPPEEEKGRALCGIHQIDVHGDVCIGGDIEDRGALSA